MRRNSWYPWFNECVYELLDQSGRVQVIYDSDADISVADWCSLNTHKMNDCTIKANSIMPDIKEYNYNVETGETYIQWSDMTETWVRAEENMPKDQNYGFMACVAKKAMGNTSRINNLYDKWAVKKPIQDKKAAEQRMVQEAEAKRIAEKRKVKREQWYLKKAALKRKREYEARKLANEKYGIPMDFEG